MVTLRHITTAEVRHQQRERERERERVKDKKSTRKKRNPNRQREKETRIFSMIVFDSATSSFLAL